MADKAPSQPQPDFTPQPRGRVSVFERLRPRLQDPDSRGRTEARLAEIHKEAALTEVFTLQGKTVRAGPGRPRGHWHPSSCVLSQARQRPALGSTVGSPRGSQKHTQRPRPSSTLCAHRSLR